MPAAFKPVTKHSVAASAGPVIASEAAEGLRTNVSGTRIAVVTGRSQIAAAKTDDVGR
jgi:hypothetical protein